MDIPRGAAKMLRREGVSSVARKYKVAYGTAMKWGFRLKITPYRPKHWRYTRYPIPKDAAKVISRDGYTAASQRFDVSEGCIKNWALRLGVKPPRICLYKRQMREKFMKHARVVSDLLVKYQDQGVVAKKLGITHQRVQQIIKKSKLVGRGWVHLKGKGTEQ